MRSRSPAPVRRTRWALAAVAYLPLLWTSPGQVTADTKSYLTIDPARLLARAPWMWDSATGLGTVSHQTIGYLFPLGPWYWLGDRLGLPDWLVQRLWLGTLFFAAGAGVLAFARHLRLPWRAAGVAALTYQLSPYLLPYAARLSAILLPWAGLGWMMTFLARALDDRRRWRWPAAFALVVLAVGGVNATALVLAGLGPVCLLVWVVAWERTVPVGRAAAVAARIGVLCVAVSLWWMVGLWVQGRYGLPILRYTETYEAVARASTPAEVLRGLGYWFGYGRDAVSPWVEPVGAYTRSPALLVATTAVPALALVALARSRWRARALPVLLVLVGVVVSVGAHPYGSPSLVGRVLRAVIGTDVGGALRSTPRAVPLVALGLGLGLGAGVEALAARRPVLRWWAPVAVVLLVAAVLPSLWAGRLMTSSILRDEALPTWWTDVAADLDGGDRSTRVLEVPGSDFASYRWGGTVDPVLVGLTDRDVTARELVPWGSPASADLLAALDRRWQDRIAEPAAVAPLLRRLAVGDVVLRGDLQYERYRLARPRTMAAALEATPGLSLPTAYGPPVANRPDPRLPLLDAEELTVATGVRDPAPVTRYGVERPLSIVRAGSAAAVVVAGDGEGLVDAAATGALDGDGVVLYAGDLVARPGALDAALAGGAGVVVTDTNRLQARRWGSVRENLGATEVAGERPLRDDPTDNRLDLFPGAGVASSTTAVLEGDIARVQATGYGNPITYTPEDRAVMAVDGDPRTAWRVGAFAEVRGERLEIRFDAPVTTDRLTLLQPLDGPRNRWITGVRLRFDGGDDVDAALDDRSRTEPGQVVEFGTRTFTEVSIEITDANFTRLPGYAGISAVGFAEVDVAGRRASEVVRLPDDVLGRVTDQDLSVVLTRWRASALDVNRSDPEPALARSFRTGAARTFTVTGTGSLSPRATDEVLNGVLAPAGVRAVASARLAGDPAGTGLAAVDEDERTVWRTPIDAPLQSLRVESPATVTVDRLRLRVVADGRHSVPTQLRLAVDGGPPRTLTVPPVVDGTAPGTVVGVPIVLAEPVSGRRFDVAVTAVREVRSIDADSRAPVVQPVGIAELGLPGVAATMAPLDPAACRDDLVTVDGRAVPVAVASSGTALTVEGCGPLDLGPGEHQLRAAAGRTTGLDLDRLVLRSAATAAPRPVTALPEVRVTRTGRTSYRATIDRATAPFWLVLGQSRNDGWHARVDGVGDLGAPVVVDGYANGWLVQPRDGTFTVELRWTPQRVVWWGLALSAVAALVCVALALSGRGDGTPAPVATAGRSVDEAGWRSSQERTRRLSAGPVAATVLALACSGWRAAVVVVAVLLVARLGSARWARLAVLAPGVLLGGVAAYAVAKQVRYDLPTDLDWPRASEAVQPLAWAAVCLIVPSFRPSRPRLAPAAPADGTDDVAAADEPPAAVPPPSWPPGLRRRPLD